MSFDFRGLNKQEMKVDYLSLNERFFGLGFKSKCACQARGTIPHYAVLLFKKARASTALTEPVSSSSFQEVLVQSGGKSYINITIQSGVKIEILFGLV
ncbi:MAG: hypothetical protein ACJASM_002300 [Salibacteraceae bacterium]|jgi:hypothetical protein